MGVKVARLSVKRGVSFAGDEELAVSEFAAAVDQPDQTAVVFFCSPRYDLERLGATMKARFRCPVIGCTTAGEISSPGGYGEGGIVGVGISSPELNIHTQLIHPLDGFKVQESMDLAGELRGELKLAENFDKEKMFGLLLVDGLSMLEEQVIASLFGHLEGVPIIGGSAGDNLDFGETFVYAEGRFLSNAAIFALFETTLPFRTFRIQHFEPTDTRLVITEADGPTRTVYEINGGPAAEEYAKAVGLEVSELSPQVFAAYPVMLRIGGEYFVRSIQKVNDDGSLTFFCAIDTGLVLTVAKGTDLLENLEKNLGRLQEELPDMQLLLGCDCILRRLELIQKGELERALPILEAVNFVGFSTYGEQYNGIHVNQTLTGLAIGG